MHLGIDYVHVWRKWTPFCFNIAGEKSGLNDPEISRHGIDWFEIFLTEG